MLLDDSETLYVYASIFDGGAKTILAAPPPPATLRPRLKMIAGSDGGTGTLGGSES